MKNSIKFAGFAGSLRSESYSRKVLEAIERMLVAQGHTVNFVDIGAMPHYNEDFDTEHAPPTVALGRRIVANADIALIVTPEFNHGIPGVLKNALDWLSRPAFTGCFLGKPVVFCSVAPGILGGVRAQYQLRETFSSMRSHLFSLPEIVIPGVASKMKDGVFSDVNTLDFIGKALSSVVAQVEMEMIRRGAEVAEPA